MKQFVGQLIYAASRHRIFSYPEEKSGFEIPEKYRQSKQEKPSRFQSENVSPADHASGSGNGGHSSHAGVQADETTLERERAGRRDSQDIVMAQDFGDNQSQDQERSSAGSRNSDDTIVNDGDNSQEGGKDGKTGQKDDTIVVDWYGPNDPENPQNWYVTPCGVNEISVLFPDPDQDNLQEMLDHVLYHAHHDIRLHGIVDCFAIYRGILDGLWCRTRRSDPHTLSKPAHIQHPVLPTQPLPVLC